MSNIQQLTNLSKRGLLSFRAKKAPAGPGEWKCSAEIQGLLNEDDLETNAKVFYHSRVPEIDFCLFAGRDPRQTRALLYRTAKEVQTLVDVIAYAATVAVRGPATITKIKKSAHKETYQNIYDKACAHAVDVNQKHGVNVSAHDLAYAFPEIMFFTLARKGDKREWATHFFAKFFGVTKDQYLAANRDWAIKRRMDYDKDGKMSEARLEGFLTMRANQYDVAEGWKDSMPPEVWMFFTRRITLIDPVLSEKEQTAIGACPMLKAEVPLTSEGLGGEYTYEYVMHLPLPRLAFLRLNLTKRPSKAVFEEIFKGRESKEIEASFVYVEGATYESMYARAVGKDAEGPFFEEEMI